VVTDVGGLSEAAADYSGTIFVPPANPTALAEGIVSALDLRAQHHTDLHTWDVSRECYATLIDNIRFTRGHVTGEAKSTLNREGHRVLTLQPSRRS
jgi:hypothetical protein